MIGVGLGGCAQPELKVMDINEGVGFGNEKNWWSGGKSFLSAMSQMSIYQVLACHCLHLYLRGGVWISTLSLQAKWLDAFGFGVERSRFKSWWYFWIRMHVGSCIPLIFEVLASCLAKGWMRKKSHGHSNDCVNGE